MPNKRSLEPDPGEAMHCQIRIQGHLGSEWTGWFEGLTITLDESGDTLLTGLVVDQAALHGLIRKVRDLGIPLLAINRIEPGKVNAPHGDHTEGKGS